MRLYGMFIEFLFILLKSGHFATAVLKFKIETDRRGGGRKVTGRRRGISKACDLSNIKTASMLGIHSRLPNVFFRAAL